MFARFRSLFGSKSKTEPEVYEQISTSHVSEHETKVNSIEKELSNSEYVDIENTKSVTTCSDKKATLEDSKGENSVTETLDKNGIQNIECEAISQKHNEVSVEQSDEGIPYVKLNIGENIADGNEVISDLHSGFSEKAAHFNSDDWQVKSMEDISYATASDGNCSPHSQSSSFITAPDRTSSRMSASDADESTLSSDLTHMGSKDSLNFTHSDDMNSNDTHSTHLHSESVTPTPSVDDQQLADAAFSPNTFDASSTNIQTEFSVPQLSVTPEVSLYSNTHAVKSNCLLDLMLKPQFNNYSYDKPIAGGYQLFIGF